MRSILFILAFGPAVTAADGFPQFKTQEIAKDLTVGYAVTLADVNGDKKPDIVVVDSRRVVWYENPSWKPRTIITGKTKPDNVCIAAHDIDRDGQVDFFLGADWNLSKTKEGGTLQWLKRGKTLDEEWTVYPIGEEPTVHRIRMADTDGDGQPELILAPLMGRDATAKANWMDGRPVRILSFAIPKNPGEDKWTSTVVSEELHVVHNFHPIPKEEGPAEILFASYEGVTLSKHVGDRGRSAARIGEGNQANPKGNRGASEIKWGKVAGDRKERPVAAVIATIEPWHGNQVVVYNPVKGQAMWDRTVIDKQLRWGHAVWFADLDGEPGDELIVGVRDNPGAKDDFKEQCGVRIYRNTDGNGKDWKRMLVDEGGVAVEDLVAGDLDGDGKIDLVAVGRATKNARIYWNLGMKK